jgi:transcriptional regulator with XRE-family HTH domain
MYRDRINEQRKIKGYSLKMVAERSKLHLPEETISRFLSNKTQDARVSTMLDVCDAVGMEPYELFMDATIALEFKLFMQAKLSGTDNATELDRVAAENVRLDGQVSELRGQVTSLTAERDLLKLQLEHKDELLRMQREHKSDLERLAQFLRQEHTAHD